ncbi:uncharacterized protein TNCV_836851 [Trichonephila clavipes]|nr:uncharacterized protein TNCV_836851 [Trichonephila clavipes]
MLLKLEAYNLTDLHFAAPETLGERWLLQIFFNILDLAGINAWILYKQTKGENLSRQEFLLKLAVGLSADFRKASEQLKQRKNTKESLPKSITDAYELQRPLCLHFDISPGGLVPDQKSVLMWMDFSKEMDGMPPKKEKDPRGSLEHLKMWKEFV